MKRLLFERRISRMKKLFIILSLAAVLPLSTAWAQLQAPNDAGVAMGHLHLLVKDVEANKKFWITMGGTPVKFGTGEALKFPGVLILLRQGDPNGNGSVGSIINHVGFHVPNVEQAMPTWRAAGLRMEPTKRQGQAYIYSPDNLRIEILENPAISVPIQFHHIHYFVSQAAPGSTDDPVLQIQAWYAKIFGAKPGKRAQWEADDLPGVNLTFATSDTATVGTNGRVLDHIGFEVKDLEAFCKKTEANGAHFDTPYTKRPELGLALAFLTDPWGTKIELTEGLNKL
jgi:catechol 2,3-dioxygenase-like lactoylglutathione lyase family enzyme